MSGLVISTVECAPATATRDIGVDAVLTAIRTGGKTLRGQIEQIRNRFEAELAFTHGDKSAAKLAVAPLKKDLPAVMWCGQFSNREKPVPEKLQKHSGLFIADLDDLSERLPLIRKKLEASPHLFALYLSPSGNGLKVVFRVPADASLQAGSFRAVEAHVKQLTDIQIDESGKDIGRLCFMSYDPELYHNPNSIEIEPLPEPEKPHFANISLVNLSERQRIATELLGNIDWQSETSGYCVCPGKHLHTEVDGERDCEVHLDGAPNIHCFHGHCKGIEAGVNHELQSRIGKAEFVSTPPANGEPVEPDIPQNADDKTITRLAALSPIEYDRIRKDEAKKLNCRESTLDSVVHAKQLLMRPQPDGDNLQGTAVKLADVEPWPEPVNGAEILNAIAKRFETYVVLPEGAADMSALWCGHTHMYKRFPISPRLHISAPTEECGKTTVRNCVSLFCARTVCTENMTTAVMFRLVTGHSPTILADECDKWLFINEELLGLVQSGHGKGGTIMRCEGDSNDLRQFDCYAPFALAAIGKLPSQLHSRSIRLRLERARKEEIKQRSVFDFEHVEYETELNRKLARWILGNRERIASCNPKLPEHLFNRIADNWRPLFKIAQIAGVDWPQRCACALAKLTTGEDERENLRVMLLVDIREVFKTERIFSKDLVEKLAELKERPWPEICRGKPITAQWLARNLAAFGIHSGNIRIGEEQAKGYERVQFDDVFARYVPETPQTSAATVPPSHSEVKPEILAVPKDEVGTGEKTAVYEALGRWDGSPTREGPRKGRI
jgi:putative DNA primase/helicase